MRRSLLFWFVFRARDGISIISFYLIILFHMY